MRSIHAVEGPDVRMRYHKLCKEFVLRCRRRLPCRFVARSRGKGSFDCVDIRIADDNSAQDDSHNRHARICSSDRLFLPGKYRTAARANCK